MQIVAVILAAGASTRFGARKQSVLIGGGRTMLDAVAETALSAGLHPIFAVVPPGLTVSPHIVPVINDAPEEGMSRSLRLGLRAVPAEADAAVILLADQPNLAVSTIRAVIDAARGDRPVVAAQADGIMAPPVLLRREAFPLADEATGDEGLRSILTLHADLVTGVPIDEHVPDVDTPADLASIGEPCPGCGALFEPLPDGPHHEYIGASAECWSAFSELLAREFGDRTYGWVHRHTVDAYAAQHPGENGRRQRQSVAIHLIGLCHWIEHGLRAEQLTKPTQVLTAEKREWPWLTPPSAYRLTVRHALAARSGAEHAQRVREWAESVWEACSEHHAQVRDWAAGALGARR